ncbi:uncharacterized protein T551_01539 [Pneumocystis jirovecii RU7]|uniref:Uncharacterized protein n=1 Tax=Pneumocystis jirovecii (strain RU7) TaxID=1408657 RepID=A0A0W4ZRH3_PNEJ7|nr:uncharacterized protein T551_01539 [Pneumocystis jirovecii RU7]KTW30987.1 hypothetical protein T551_01539 [Pneumocystis jirovecii RU7]
MGFVWVLRMKKRFQIFIIVKYVVLICIISYINRKRSPPSSKYHPLAEHMQPVSRLRCFSSKKQWIMNSKGTTYETQLPTFLGKAIEKAPSEPIASVEKEPLRKGKRRRNSDLPELSINYETKRIRALSVSPKALLDTQCSDMGEEQSTTSVKKRKKETNTGIDTRNVSAKGRQNEKSKGKTNEKKTKSIDDNSDLITNSSKSKQISSKTNTQNNMNRLTETDQKPRSKAKPKKVLSNVRYQHDTRHTLFQKDSEQTFPNVLNIIDKPSRPRIPQAKITMTEMKKRVAAILEYIGRTQLEMASDQEHRKRLFIPLLQKIDKEITDKKENLLGNLDKKKTINISQDKNNIIENSSDANSDMFHYNFDSFEMMDNLTKQLLEWEEKFGSYKDKNS